MAERGITELELRAMLERARSCRPSTTEGRFVVETTHVRRHWKVVLEPDHELRCIVVVTAYTKE